MRNFLVPQMSYHNLTRNRHPWISTYDLIYQKTFTQHEESGEKRGLVSGLSCPRDFTITDIITKSAFLRHLALKRWKTFTYSLFFGTKIRTIDIYDKSCSYLSISIFVISDTWNNLLIILKIGERFHMVALTEPRFML